MKKTILVTLGIVLSIASAKMQAQRCENGFAGVYPCHLVDQLGMIPLAQLYSAQNTNDIWGWTNPVSGREFVTLGLSNGTAFIDITTPERPLYLGVLPTQTFPSLWRDIKVINGFAFIVAEAPGHGMQVFDLRRLEHLSYNEIPKVFAPDTHYPAFGNAHNIAADTESGYVYAVGSNTFAGGLHIVDVNNPLSPVYAGSSEEDGYTHDVQVVVYHGPDQQYQGQQIAFAANENTVTIFDVTDKTDVQMLSRTPYDLVGYTHQCWLTEDHRYLLCDDELDELLYGINTRTIVWDVLDLDNPVPIGYVDLGNPSIDHNLYTRGNLVYESNYTSGLRILDLNNVASGMLNHFGFFDVYPDGDPVIFQGTWSNYPYFDSEVVAVSSMGGGVHFVKPRFLDPWSTVIKVCGSGSQLVPISVNRPKIGPAALSVQLDNGASGVVSFMAPSALLSLPGVSNLALAGLNEAQSGYYSGRVVVNYGSSADQIPFVLVLNVSDLSVPTLLQPENGALLPSQSMTFQWNDPVPGYAFLQVSVDPDFQTIVYEKEIFGPSTTFDAYMPFNLTTYYWRLTKPKSCGNDVTVPMGTFTIDTALSTSDSPMQGQSGLQLYPNPTDGQLWVRYTSQGQQVDRIEIFDVSGRMVDVLNTRFGAEPVLYNASALKPGVYIARTSAGDALRFIKR